jgi:hypothetical protein
MIRIYVSHIEKSFLESANIELNSLLNYYFYPLDDTGDGFVFDNIFPEHLYRKNKEKCIEIANELREWVRDSSVHTLKPLYEYVLINILYNIKDLQEYYLGEDKMDSDDFFDEEVNGGYTLSDLKDINFYINNCFEDHDFVNVGEVYEAFINNPLILDRVNIDLDQYKDLVPWDVVEQYEKVKELFFVINNMMRDRVTLIKTSGEAFEDIKSSVQGRKIFIGESTLEIVEGDSITRYFIEWHSRKLYCN